MLTSKRPFVKSHSINSWRIWKPTVYEKIKKKKKIQRTRFNSNIEPFVILVIGTIEKVTDFLENAPKSAKNSALIRKSQFAIAKW